MPDKTEKGLRLLCIALLAVLACQLVKAGFRANPLAHVTIPAIPTLATNSPATNSVASSPAKPPMPMAKTNFAAGTNAVAASNTNAPASTTGSTNLLAATNAVVASTNAVSVTATSNTVVKMTPPVSDQTNLAVIPNSAPTNSVATNAPGTNPVTTNSVAAPGTNQAHAEGIASGTNAAPPRPLAKAKKPPGGGMPFGPGGGPGRPSALPPATQAWVDKIVDSEIFAPVMRPQPMALMGIAGNVAFLRSPSGQTGLVKVGDSLGEIKLIKIGINRVLVEQDGQPKELTVFNGYGSDSLLLSQPSPTAP